MLDLLPAEERDDRQLVTITRNLGHLLNADGFAVACEATTSRRWRREATVPTVTGPRSPHAAARNAAEYVKKEGPHED
jgi:hypothetical protein